MPIKGIGLLPAHDWKRQFMFIGGQLIAENDPSSLWQASVFVKTTPDKSPRQASQAGGRQAFVAAFTFTYQQNVKN